MCSESSHARLKTYSLLDHIFCDGKWIVSDDEKSCKVCVADFTAVVWIQIPKFKMQKKKKKVVFFFSVIKRKTHQMVGNECQEFKNKKSWLSLGGKLR